MTDDEFQAVLRGLSIRLNTAAAERAEYEARKALAEAEAAEHTRDYVRDYYKIPAPSAKGSA